MRSLVKSLCQFVNSNESLKTGAIGAVKLLQFTEKRYILYIFIELSNNEIRLTNPIEEDWLSC